MLADFPVLMLRMTHRGHQHLANVTVRLLCQAHRTVVKIAVRPEVSFFPACTLV
jgi:hypothetical protein